MKTLIATIRGTTRYSQSRPHGLIRGADEDAEAFDLRNVREHLHVGPAGPTVPEGMVYIPPAQFKNCLDEAAKFEPIKLQGSSTFTKHFEAGVAVFEPIPLGVHKDCVQFEKLYMDLNGNRGSGKRGFRYYPYIDAGWIVDVSFAILDETVLRKYEKDQSQTVFEHVLRSAGVYIGIGRWRPRNRGLYGRFAVERIVEATEELLMAAE